MRHRKTKTGENTMHEFEIEELTEIEIRLTDVGEENIYFEYRDSKGELQEGFCKCADQWLRTTVLI